MDKVPAEMKEKTIYYRITKREGRHYFICSYISLSNIGNIETKFTLITQTRVINWLRSLRINCWTLVKVRK